MPGLRQLEYLQTVAEEGHFGQAAARLHVTQPTLSMQIAKLERELGMRLLERGSGRVTPTPAGRVVLERARVILAEVEAIRHFASGKDGEAGGLVHLGVPPTLGPYLLPELVGRLHREMPALRLYVREGTHRLLEERLIEGVHDLIVTPMPLRSRLVECRPLFRETLQLAIPPDHRLAGRGTVAREELRGEKILTMEGGHHLREHVSALCEEFDAELSRDFEGTSLDTLRHMVGMGLGLAFLPALYVRSEIRSHHDIAVARIEGRQPERQIGLARRANTPESAVWKHIREHIPVILGNIPEIRVVL